jgi:Microtubule-binding stalk of dynein motor
LSICQLQREAPCSRAFLQCGFCAGQAEVIALTGQLQQLREQFEKKTTEAMELRHRANTMERRLSAASRLIEGLGSERLRWTADLLVYCRFHDF